MKTSLLTILLAGLLADSAHAQVLAATRVPAVVVASFHKNFPAVKTVKWEKENHDYEAGFTVGKMKMSAVITAAGVLRETETTLPVAQLPAAIQKTLNINYKAAKITEAAKIVTAATGITTYEAEISQGGQHHDVLFHADGTEVVKK